MTPAEAPTVADEFRRSGRVWFRDAVAPGDLAALDATCTGDRPGLRLRHGGLLHETLARGLRPLIDQIAPGLVPVRIVTFSKGDGTNWAVPWHQDRVIAVAERHDLSGYGNWSRKSGIWHCEPPVEILDRMVFARVHLDPASAEDGAMRIAPGSHVEGFVPSSESAARAAAYPAETCEAARGDVLALHMLTLHASSPSVTGRQRRVLRVDLAPPDLLPWPLAWDRAEGSST